MKPYEVTTFKYGLDTRKEILTSQPGTLFQLVNASINPGGDIEKRKAFVQNVELFSNDSGFDNGATSITSITTAIPSDQPLPVATAVTAAAHQLREDDWILISGAVQGGYNGVVQVFNVTTTGFSYYVATALVPATGTIVFADSCFYGLEVTSAGLVVFGSALTYGSSAAQGQPIIQNPIPTGVTYQQLKHPSIYNDTTETYVRSRHRLTYVVGSINYKGKAVVMAAFADGRRFLYYNGALVEQSANGIVMAGRVALADLANDLDRQIEAIGWRSDANVDENGVTQNGSDIVKSPSNNYYDAVPSDTSTLGVLGYKKVDQDIASVNPVSAEAGFQVTGITGTFTVTAPTNSDGTGTTNLTGGAIQGITDAATTAALIGQAINDLTFVHGYTAVVVADKVYIYAPVGYNVSPNPGVSLTVTTSAVAPEAVALATSDLPTTFYTYVYNPVPLATLTTTGTVSSISGTITVLTSGGTIPYTYAWSPATTGSDVPVGYDHAITMRQTNVAQGQFNFDFRNTGQPLASGTATGFFKCIVTDNASPTKATRTHYVTVTFRCIVK